jgi:hypothetical protein
LETGEPEELALSHLSHVLLGAKLWEQGDIEEGPASTYPSEMLRSYKNLWMGGENQKKVLEHTYCLL